MQEVRNPCQNRRYRQEIDLDIIILVMTPSNTEVLNVIESERYVGNPYQNKRYRQGILLDIIVS